MKVKFNSFQWVLLIVLSIGCGLPACAPKNKVSKSSEPTPQKLPEVTSTSLDYNSVENALLWEISGNGLKEPSYLYGTIHMIDKEHFFLPDPLEGKFAKAEQLALEIDMDDPSLMFTMLTGVFMKGGVALDDLMTEEEYKKLSDYFKKSTGMGIGMFKKMKPILLSTMMTEEMMKGTVVSYEEEFVKMAKKQKIEILGVETINDQLSIFDSIPYKEQAQMLLQSMEGGTENAEEEFDSMVKAYKDQDLDRMAKMINDESESLGKYQDLLLNKRNKNWIPVINEMIREKVTFIAVGAGHLGGKEGVIHLLREAGFTLKPLR